MPRSSPVALLLVAGLACGVAGAGACSDGLLTLTAPGTSAGDGGPPLAGCVDGKPSGYPAAPYDLKILATVAPDLSFAGAAGAVRMQSFFDPCTARPRLLVVRTGAAWCGSCQWHAAHTKRFVEDPRFTGRLELLDLLVADEDNAPATPAALDRWRAKIDAPGQLALDPAYTFAPALIAPGPLPAYAFIDTKTMTIRSTLANPDPESLAGRIAIELASIAGEPAPAPVAPTLLDGTFTEDVMDQIRGMTLVAAPPPDPTNEVADVPAAAAFGKQLFNDTKLSPTGVACGTCHDPGQDLSDGQAQSTGVAKVDRNSPQIGLSSHGRWQFWDGRADTQWMQALGPPEDAREFGSNRIFLVRQVVTRYLATYDAVFGAKYPLTAEDVAALPMTGKPGDPAYEALSAADKDKVTRVYVNLGKAIAAYERTIRVQTNALDRYAGGQTDALTPPQKQGLALFFANGCAQCHWGPRLTDDAFHVVRFGTGRQDHAADPGRSVGLQKLAAAEFGAASRWSDAPSAAKLFNVDVPTALGAFKTPTLRGLPSSAPYGHGGTLAALLDVTQQYSRRGLSPLDSSSLGTTEPWVPHFDDDTARNLVPFLEALKATVAVE